MRSISGIFFIAFCFVACSVAQAEQLIKPNYEQARWHPIHFKPLIDTATNEQCLACHQEILQRKPRTVTPAGVKAADTLAWYQTLGTYKGEQDTFHRRHLSSEFAQSVMQLNCNTCHQGHDPRDEHSYSSANVQSGLTNRKLADPYICVMCHGQFDAAKMGVPKSWYESSGMFGDSCLTCHAAIKTERHKEVTFLKADAIEAAGKKDGDACFGCHGGRAFFQIPFPYSDKKWPGWSNTPLGIETKYSK